jgi:hypothetical protein
LGLRLSYFKLRIPRIFVIVDIAMGRKLDKKAVVDVDAGDSDEVEDIEDIDEDELLGMEGIDRHQDEGEELRQQHEEVLEIIKAQTQEGPDGEKLTWLALYSLKHQELQLTEKENEEINLIKDKYSLLKQPLHEDIAKAATGQTVETQLY